MYTVCCMLYDGRVRRDPKDLPMLQVGKAYSVGWTKLPHQGAKADALDFLMLRDSSCLFLPLTPPSLFLSNVSHLFM